VETERRERIPRKSALARRRDGIGKRAYGEEREKTSSCLAAARVFGSRMAEEKIRETKDSHGEVTICTVRPEKFHGRRASAKENSEKKNGLPGTDSATWWGKRRKRNGTP